MLNVIAALAVGLQAPAAPAPSPSALISKMLAFYNDAQMLVGTITMTQKVGEHGGSIVTNVQFDQPDKLYIRQQKSIGDRSVWMIVANGKHFAYDAPDLRTLSVNQRKRLVEAQTLPNKKLGIREVYAAGAVNLGDRSTPLDIAIGRKEDLMANRDQWKTVEYKGTVEHNGATVHVIMGAWRPYGTAEAVGQYRMYITDRGELLQFARSETMQIEGQGPMQIVTTWDVKLEKNGSPDPKLFAKIQ